MTLTSNLTPGGILTKTGLGTLTLTGSVTSDSNTIITGGALVPTGVFMVDNSGFTVTFGQQSTNLALATRNRGHGDFDLPYLSSTLAWDTSAFSSYGVLGVVMVPEPGLMQLLLIGIFGIIQRRRRPSQVQ